MQDAVAWRGGLGRMWGSLAVSLFGTQVSLLALPLTALGALGASAGQVALLAAAGTAPFLLFGLPAGAWVERWPRRKTMVVADLVRAGVLGSVPAAYAFGALTLAHLYVAAFVVGTLSVFFDVASLSALPALVPAARLAAANGRLEAARAVSQTSGPALGGVLVQLVTAPFAVLLDAVSYLASAVLLRGLPALPPGPAPHGREPLVGQVLAGLRFCVRHRYIRPLAAGAAWMNFWVEALMAVLVTYAVREEGLTAATVGLVLAGSNLGYLAGSMLVPWLNDRIGVGRGIVLGAALQAGFVVAALAPEAGTATWMSLGLGISAAGTGIWNVNAVSLRQVTTPDSMLARMNASNRFLIWGTMPLGAAAGAGLAGVLGLHVTVVVCAVLAPVSALPVLVSAVRRVATMPTSALLDGPAGALVPAADGGCAA